MARASQKGNNEGRRVQTIEGFSHELPIHNSNFCPSSHPPHTRIPNAHTTMRSLTSLLAVAALCLAQAQALYIYFDGHHPKCFYEELPKDTLVTGTLACPTFSTTKHDAE